MPAFIEWDDVVKALIEIVGVLPVIFGIALGIGFGLVAFGWLMRRDPIIKAQAETNKHAAEVILKYTEAIERYNQQVLGLQNDLDASNDAHAEALKKQSRLHQNALDTLANEVVRVKQAAKIEREDRARCEQEMQAQINTLIRDLHTATSKVGELTALAQQKDEQIAILTNQIDRLTSRIIDLEKENRGLTGKVGTLENEREQLQGERKLLIRQIAELSSERDEQKRQLAEMQTKLEALEKRDTGALHTPEAAEAVESAAVEPSTEEAAAESADSESPKENMIHD